MRVGGGVHGVQNPLFPHAKVIFLQKWKKEMEEIRWNDLHFYIVDTCGAMPKQGSWDYFELGPEGGGGGLLTFFSEGVTSSGRG